MRPSSNKTYTFFQGILLLTSKIILSPILAKPGSWHAAVRLRTSVGPSSRKPWRGTGQGLRLWPLRQRGKRAGKARDDGFQLEGNVLEGTRAAVGVLCPRYIGARRLRINGGKVAFRLHRRGIDLPGLKVRKRRGGGVGPGRVGLRRLSAGG